MNAIISMFKTNITSNKYLPLIYDCAKSLNYFFLNTHKNFLFTILIGISPMQTQYIKHCSWYTKNIVSHFMRPKDGFQTLLSPELACILPISN